MIPISTFDIARKIRMITFRIDQLKEELKNAPRSEEVYIDRRLRALIIEKQLLTRRLMQGAETC